jgi:hypothetical protein
VDDVVATWRNLFGVAGGIENVAVGHPRSAPSRDSDPKTEQWSGRFLLNR